MQKNILVSLVSSLKTQNSNDFSKILDDKFDLFDLQDEYQNNIFHHLAMIDQNEKYFLPFIDLLIQSLKTKNPLFSVQTFLNSPNINEQQTPLHLAIIYGKSV